MRVGVVTACHAVKAGNIIVVELGTGGPSLALKIGDLLGFEHAGNARVTGLAGSVDLLLASGSVVPCIGEDVRLSESP